jgi:hypothetical protein
MIRRGFAYFVLAFALLFAQQGGIAHELSHFARDASQSEKQLPHSKACGQCVSYSQVDAGAVSQAVPFALPEAGGASYVFRGVAYSAQRSFSYRSRAPPALA